MIVTVALVMAPVLIPGPSEDVTVKLILNVSSPSTMLSSVTGIFTILLLVPAVIVTLCILEVKSFPNIRRIARLQMMHDNVIYLYDFICCDPLHSFHITCLLANLRVLLY